MVNISKININTKTKLFEYCKTILEFTKFNAKYIRYRNLLLYIYVKKKKTV